MANPDVSNSRKIQRSPGAQGPWEQPAGPPSQLKLGRLLQVWSPDAGGSGDQRQEPDKMPEHVVPSSSGLSALDARHPDGRPRLEIINGSAFKG